MGDYFAAVTAHDADLLRTLFAPDATFDVDGDIRRGHEQILAYYTERTFTFDDFRPEAHPLHVEGSTVTVDIDVHIGGADNRVRDVFELADGHITSLVVRGFADALRAAGPVPDSG
jgi:ketosteroid isomerase-like protein